MKLHTIKLTNNNWKLLNDLGIVDGIGNGFANTTKEFEDLINVSTTPKYIQVKNNVFEVAYYSGCFYPIWYKITYVTNYKPFEKLVIKRNKHTNVLEGKLIIE